MRVLVALALIGCGSRATPAPLSSTASARSSEPLLLYTVRVGDSTAQLRWVASEGGTSHAPTGDAVTDIAWLDDLGDGDAGQGRWLRAVHEHADEPAELVRARRVGDGVELASREAPTQAAVSPDGATVAGDCTDPAAPGICVWSTEGRHLAAPRHLATAIEDDHIVGWRGAAVVVSDAGMRELALLDPRSRARRTLAPLPEKSRYVSSDPRGDAFVSFDPNGDLGHVLDIEHPERGFIADARPAVFMRFHLVSPAVLVCSERGERGKLIAVYTAAGRSEVAHDTDEVFAALPDRVAFVDRAAHQLVVTDLHGEHRRVLLDIPAAARVSPVAWLR